MTVVQTLNEGGLRLELTNDKTKTTMQVPRDGSSSSEKSVVKVGKLMNEASAAPERSN